MNGPVVVGVDDVEHSGHALDVAAREARLREAPLWLVHAYHWIPPMAFGAALAIDIEEGARGAAESLLGEAAAAVRAAHPGLAVETVPVGGPIPQVLVETCPDAALLVVGERGRGGFGGLLLGSVAQRTVRHSHVPVMVVRERRHPGRAGHVVLGLDLDEPVSGPELMEFAFTEAALRRTRLQVIHAWGDNGYLYLSALGEYLTEQFDAVTADRERRLEALLEPWQEKHPDVRVSRRLIREPASRALVEASDQAELLVVGAQARAAGHEGLRIGAVAQTVLHHAHCPVVVVPEH